MRKVINEGNRSGGLSLFDALIRDRIARSGSQKDFASNLGINPQTVSRWVRRETNPLANDTREAEILAEGVGRSLEDLRTLGAIGVLEACDNELDRARVTSSQEAELQKRFLELISKKGTLIPAAAFIIYLTGDFSSRSKLVAILENGEPEVPEDITQDSLQFALDIMKFEE